MSRVAVVWVLLVVAAGEAAAQHADHAEEPTDRAGHAEEHTDHAGHAEEPTDHADHPPSTPAEPHDDRGVADSATDAHDGHQADRTQDSSQEVPPGTPPPAARSGPEHAADTIFGAEDMAAARELLRIEQGGFRTQMVLADRFEARAADGDESYVWDLQGWYGGDIHKLWWKSEGAGEFNGNPDDAELQALYSRAVTPFFDFQAGVRHDFKPSPQRSHAVLGVQGLLPYVFEIDAAAFVSEDGDLSGQFEAEYDLRILQRLVLQPRIELDFAAQAIPELEIGPGLGAVEGGFRLRYEISREIAPYLGLGWERKLGRTADLARAAGNDPRSWEFIVGVRAWF